jgi:WD40 repeat protein
MITVAVAALALLWPGVAAPKQTGDQPDRLQHLWNDLANADAAKAYRAILSLVQTPTETTAFIKVRLQTAAAPDSAKVKQWIADLAAGNFTVRSKANAELQKLAELIEPSLQIAVKDVQSLEVRRRIEELLSKQQGSVIHLPTRLQAVRAVEVLEQIGNDDARRLLRSYAAGTPASRHTQAAAAALDRLARRPAEAPMAAAKKPRVDRYGDALPAGAIARLGTARFRKPAIGMAGFGFLPDGKTLLTAASSFGTGENEVQLWEVATGRLLHELRPEFLWGESFALAPGGTQFAAAARLDKGSEIRVCDLLSGKVVKAFPRKNVDHCQMAFSPDGKLLFSRCPRDGFLHIDDIATGKEVRHLKFPVDDSGSIAVTADGAYLAVATGNHSSKLFLWKWRTDEPQEIELPHGAPTHVSFSQDGKLLATVGPRRSEARLCVCEVPAGRLLYQQASAGKFSYYGRAVFTPDGKTLAVPTSGNGMSRGETHLLDPRTGKLQATLDGPAYWLAASPDSRLLATAAGSRVRLWDLATRTEIGANDEAHWRPVVQIRVSSAGHVATIGDDDSIRLWDADTSQQRRKIMVDDRTEDIQFSPDGGVLVASNPDDSVLVWDTRTGREIYRLAGHGEYGGGTLGFLPDGRRFLSWGDDSYVRLWDMKTGKALLEHSIRPSVYPDGPERSECVITPDGKTLIWTFPETVHLFDVATGKERRKFPGAGGDSGPITVSPDSKYLLTTAINREEANRAMVYDLATGNAVLKLGLPGVRARCVTFSPDGRTFAMGVGWAQSEVLVYEMASGKVRSTIRDIRGSTKCLAFYPDSRRLAVGFSDSIVVIWDLAALSDK